MNPIKQSSTVLLSDRRLRTQQLGMTGLILILLGLVMTPCYAQGAGPDGVGSGEAQKPVTVSPGLASARIQALTGAWQNVKPTVGLTRPGVAPLRPEYNARLEQLVKLAVAGDEVTGNEPRCIPNGPVMDMAFGMRVFADQTQMAIVTSGPRVRYVWLDGRAHTADDFLFETYSGESIAHWEDDVLVIDIIGLKATNEIVFGIASNATRMHVVERWKLTSPSTLEIQTTVEDPVALTKPWNYKRTYARRALSDDVTYCTPATDRSRDGEFDLTPPPGGYVPPGADPR